MSYPGPIQWYHFQIDLIWPVPLKQKIKKEIIVSHVREQIFQKPAPEPSGYGSPFYAVLLYTASLQCSMFVQGYICTVHYTLYCVHNMAVKNTMTTRITRGVR